MLSIIAQLSALRIKGDRDRSRYFKKGGGGGGKTINDPFTSIR